MKYFLFLYHHCQNGDDTSIYDTESKKVFPQTSRLQQMRLLQMYLILGKLLQKYTSPKDTYSAVTT
jgi:hypothetical protein